jgi:hypothetical protein
MTRRRNPFACSWQLEPISEHCRSAGILKHMHLPCVAVAAAVSVQYIYRYNVTQTHKSEKFIDPQCREHVTRYKPIRSTAKFFGERARELRWWCRCRRGGGVCSTGVIFREGRKGQARQGR